MSKSRSKAELELYKEYIEEDENEIIEKLIPLLKKLILKNYLTGTTYRDTHSKGHAAVKAALIVDDDLQNDLKVGVVKRAASYPAWIRFSNLSPIPQNDKVRDIRAMSIKLMDVDGTKLWENEKGENTLDFVLMGSPTFLAGNLRDFYDLELAIYNGAFQLTWFLITHPKIAYTIISGQKECANLVEIPYFSQTAYAFGDRAVHYYLKPCAPPVSEVPRNPSPNYLRELLREQLGREEVRFEWLVQFQKDPVKQPIENPLVAWSPHLSQYRKVATIRIPRQQIDSPEQMQFCENLSFNPWRCLPEHRPLGAINRARLRIYPAISKFRHERNNAPIKEPVAGDNFFDPAPISQSKANLGA
jgi:hypothetical protein